MHKAILIFMLLPAAVFGQEWRVVPSGVSNTLKDVQFVNKQTGYIVGEQSTMFKTTDGGTTWFPITLGFAGDIRAVSFTSELNGWIAVTSNVGGPKTGDVYHTTDGGYTWLNGGLGYSVEDIQFIDKDTGWVIGYNHNVFRTTNGGRDWVDKREGLWGVFKSCSFINGMEGWVAGAYSYHDNFDEEVIWHTTDGGETWEFQEGINRYGPLNKIHVLPSGVGFAYGWGEGMRTTNRGNPWERGGPGNQATALFALDEEHVYVGCGWSTEFHIYSSTDIGKTWRIMDTELENMTMGIYFADTTFGFAVGFGGKIWRYHPTSVGVERTPPPAAFDIHVYPNPLAVGQELSITYTLPPAASDETVHISITDILGRRIRQIERLAEPGSHTVSVSTSGMTPGLYFYELKTPRVSAHGSMMVTK